MKSPQAMVGNIKSNMTVAGKFLNQLLAETQTNAERTQHTVTEASSGGRLGYRRFVPYIV